MLKYFFYTQRKLVKKIDKNIKKGNNSNNKKGSTIK